MNTQLTALKLALEALEELNNTNSHWWQEVDATTIAKIDPAITAINQARSAPVQERKPVCWDGEDKCPNRQACCDAQHCLYTTSPAAPVQEPESFEQWNAKQHGDPEEIGFLQALRIAYCAGQDSVTKTTPPGGRQSEDCLTAAQRQWVGLTIQEANELWESTDSDWELMKRTEAKLREKNQ